MELVLQGFAIATPWQEIPGYQAKTENAISIHQPPTHFASNHPADEITKEWRRFEPRIRCAPRVSALFDLIKACGKQKNLHEGSRIHADLLERGLLKKHIRLGNALLSMYVKCGALTRAQELFDKLPARNVVTWTALIAGYVQHGLADEALSCFERMRDECISPNAVTFICIIKACSSIGAAEKGEEIHMEVRKQGLLGKNIALGTALVDMYAKCGALAKAQEVFDELPTQDIVAWNAIIAGYSQHGLGDEALCIYERMQDEGLSPDAVTFACILKACGSVRAAEKGEEIHGEICRQELLQNDDVLGTALVDMYGKCAALAKAQEVFNKLPARNVVTWTALITGYTQNDLVDEALSCFEQLQEQGFYPDTVTFISVLKACASIGAANMGEELHAEVNSHGQLEKDIVLGNALVDMYANCGALAKAQEVFDELPARDIVTWNALIAGYAQLGEVKRVIDSLQRIVGEGLEPNGVTFLALLIGCSHAGLVKEGQTYFDTMSTIYCIIPTLEYHACMVDLFSRAGQFDKAISIIEDVAPSDGLSLWSALIGACQQWANAELGRCAFEHAVQLDRTFAGAYVCMSNIYATCGMQEEFTRLKI